MAPTSRPSGERGGTDVSSMAASTSNLAYVREEGVSIVSEGDNPRAESVLTFVFS